MNVGVPQELTEKNWLGRNSVLDFPLKYNSNDLFLKPVVTGDKIRLFIIIVSGKDHGIIA